MRSIRTTVLGSIVLAALILVPATPASAVFFHIGSGSIDGSLCVGNDCVNVEAFGFDTIRLKENNLRIHFEDTSVAAAFPPNDWRIIINDSANGGSSHFTVEDASAGRNVFRVFAGARSNALVVDSQGDVGLGTTTPALDIDIKTGDSPGLRLQQDGTSGFTPQTWDVVGNETNFFIRDATNGSQLPFRIRPGAPTSSIEIEANGSVGIQTGSPQVLGVETTLTLGEVANAEPARLGFQTDDEDWIILVNDNNGRMTFASDTNANILQINQTGLTPGGLAGTALCVGVNNQICECGSCP